MNDIEIGGTCEERFLPIREAFAKNFEDGMELGASFALMIGDEPVVDLWGGFADRKRQKPWGEDTVVSVASSSKIIISLCGLLAVDRGYFDLDEPIARYWPKFAQSDKEDVLVRQIFSHSTGVPHLDGKPGFDVLDDWDEVIGRIERQKPWYEPGLQSAYAPFIYGHLIGELIRRTTGRRLDDFFKEEIAKPLDIDFSFGHSEGNRHRLAQDIQGDMSEVVEEVSPDPDSVGYRAIGYVFVEDAALDYIMAKGGRTGVNIPAINGVTNARAMARAGSLLAQGGKAQGRRFMSKEAAALPYQEQIYVEDLVMVSPLRMGLGYSINSAEVSFPWPNAFHWGGQGGSCTVMVPELEASWAYTPSHHIAGRRILDPRFALLQEAVFKCLA